MTLSKPRSRHTILFCSPRFLVTGLGSMHIPSMSASKGTRWLVYDGSWATKHYVLRAHAAAVLSSSPLAGLRLMHFILSRPMYVRICRHLGSAKFGSFLFLAAVLSKSIELAICVQFPFLRPPPGPVAILSAVAVAYYGERQRGPFLSCLALVIFQG